MTSLFADTAPVVAGSPGPAATGEYSEVRQLAAPALEFWVGGKAQPKGSRTPMRRGEHVVMIESADMASRKPGGRKKGGELAAWSKAVAQVARVGWGSRAPLDEAVHVVAEFRMARPSSHRAWASYLHTRPDVDKILRAVLDALQTAGVVREDSRVVAPWPIKRLCEKDQEPGVRVRVWPLGEWEAAGWILHVPDHPALVRKGGAA